MTEKKTPREEFESQFGSITDEQWDWLKEFVNEQLTPHRDTIQIVLDWMIGDDPPTSMAALVGQLMNLRDLGVRWEKERPRSSWANWEYGVPVQTPEPVERPSYTQQALADYLKEEMAKRSIIVVDLDPAYEEWLKAGRPPFDKEDADDHARDSADGVSKTD